jgi:general secretion pathway protein H
LTGGGSISAVRPQEAGLTLIEMLVVLAILAVAAGAVTLGIGAATRAPTVETEARRLAARLQAAADDAMLGDQMVAFTVEEHGYGFSSFAEGQLVPRRDAAFGYHELPGGMVMTLNVKPPVVLGPDGAGEPLSAVIESGKQRWKVYYDGITATVSPAPAEEGA